MNSRKPNRSRNNRMRVSRRRFARQGLVSYDLLERRELLATLFWQGDASSDWSNDENWNLMQDGTGLDATPADGDDLIFDTNTPGVGNFSNNNDIAGLTDLTVAFVDDDGGDDFNISGNSIGLASGTSLTHAGSQAATLVSVELTGAGGVEVDSGTLNLAGANSFSGMVDVDDGTLLITGSTAAASTINVNNGGTLGGNGNLQGVVNVNSGGTLIPGLSTGIIMTGALDMDAGSTFTVEIDGDGGTTPATAGAGNFDQVLVTGSVMLAGNLEIDETFTPNAGQSFMIVDNDGVDEVIGLFTGLGEGDIVTNNFNGDGLTAVISYIGGDGNDVVLSILGAVTAVDDMAEVDEDETIFINVLDNDSITSGIGPTLADSNPTMTLEGGTLVQNGNGFDYTPALNFNGSDSFVYTITNGSETDTATVSITVNPINDAPVISAPTLLTTNEDEAFIFSGIEIVDVDSDNITVNLSVADGGLSSMALSETSFSGTPEEVTAMINGVTYTPLGNSTALDPLNIRADDGVDISEETVNITINPINDPPVNTVPGAQTLFNDETLSFTNNEFQVSDVDATTLEVQLTVNGGILILDNTSGLTVNGNSSNSVNATGAISSLNSALNSLIYEPDDTFVGDDTLSLTTSDGGQTGDGGTLTDTDNVVITVEGMPSIVNEKFEDETFALDTDTGFQVVNPTGTNNVLQSLGNTRFASSVLDPSEVLPNTGVVITTEVTTTAATGNLFSNGFIVFDYVNANTYKVAGIEAKNQTWVIAQVAANNYTRLAQTSDSSLSETATHNLELRMNPSGVTLVTPDGIRNLNLSGNFLDSNVGVGSVFATSFFDCFRIDPITPTVLVSEDFEDTPFEFNENGFSVVDFPGNNSAFQSPDNIRNATSILVDPVTPVSNPLHVSVDATLTASNGNVYSNGFIVFDYMNSDNYKLAGVEGKNQMWSIAQFSNGNYTRLASVLDSSISKIGTFDLDLMLTSGGATLMTPNGLNNVQIGGNNFLMYDLGVGTILADTVFDNFTVTEENGATS